MLWMGDRVVAVPGTGIQHHLRGNLGRTEALAAPVPRAQGRRVTGRRCSRGSRMLCHDVGALRGGLEGTCPLVAFYFVHVSALGDGAISI